MDKNKRHKCQDQYQAINLIKSNLLQFKKLIKNQSDPKIFNLLTIPKIFTFFIIVLLFFTMKIKKESF